MLVVPQIFSTDSNFTEDFSKKIVVSSPTVASKQNYFGQTSRRKSFKLLVGASAP